MKKIIFIILLLVFMPTLVLAQTKQVALDSCVQGDRVKFKDSEGFVTTYQFHSIISPSTNHITKGEEQYSKEAFEYTCNRLTNASSILIEEVETTATDHGEAFVFVDNILLQEELLKLGYAKISYLEENNPYYEILAQAEAVAKENKIGVWVEEEKTVEDVLGGVEIEKIPNDKITNEKSNNPVMGFLDGILDNLVAGINKMLDSILQKINNML